MPKTVSDHPNRDFWFDLIITLVNQSDLSIREIARRTGISRGSLRRIVNKTAHGIKMDSVENMLDLFGYELDAIQMDLASVVPSKARFCRTEGNADHL